MRKKAGWILGILFLGAIIWGSQKLSHVVLSSAVLHQKEQAGEACLILDAGHGGQDGGKIGVHKEMERDINLQIVQKIRERLEKEKPCKIRVILTREDENGLAEDNVKDLKERVRMINETKPDLVVSIHQNSYTDERIKGAQVFYHTASEEGKKAAEQMQTSLYTLDEMNHRQAKENQTYYLLKKTEVPVIIVECGFLSNPDEAEKLSSESYQDQVAEAVAKGILSYFGKGEN